MNLAEKTCTPCRGGVPPLTRIEAEGLLAHAPLWTLAGEASRVERTYRFKNFGEALEFVRDGTITDSKTALALMYVAGFRTGD